MHVQTIEGVVHNGQIELQDEVKLPEDTVVYVVIPAQRAGSASRIFSPRFANPEQAKEFKKLVVEIVPDAKV